jgi:hypothetical protein
MVVLFLAIAPAVLAGGWAVISLDGMPGEIRAGEPWTVGFTVLQHGQTPVHKLDAGYNGALIEPMLTAQNTASNERVRAVATPTEEVGHFVVEVTFPSEGEWEWTIHPNPLMGETQFEPLNVLPAVASSAPAPSNSAAAEPIIVPAAPQQAPGNAPQTAAPTGVAAGIPASALLRWGALAVALLALALFVIQNRRPAQPAGVES